ncbi:MAG: endonuclease/exonuclease/phosphatase family protein [Candidatus Heimdallarchaeota archaeon]
MKQRNLFYTLAIVWLLALLPIFPFYSNDRLNIPSDSSIRVMTYNLHFGQNFDGKYDIGGFKDVIKKQKPNIVSFQEVTYQSPFNGYTTMFIELKSLMKSLGFDYFYTSEGYNYNLGNTVFSQYEITSTKTINYNDWNAWQRNAVEVTINVNGNNVIVYSTHLTHIPGGGTGEVRIKEVEQLLKIVANHDLNSENIIMMGDFNIVPVDDDGNSNQEYLLIISQLDDAWVEATSSGDGFTVPADDPKKRIDYIFVSTQLNVTSCELYDSLASDHLPVTCELVLG